MNNYQLTIDNEQLPEGYKRTEVGVIPEDWQEMNLADLAEIIDGDRGTNYPTDSDFSSDGYCLFLSARNVTQEGFRFSECFFITEAKDRLLRKGRLSGKDVVLTTRGTVGNFAFFDDSVPYDAIRINSGMVLLRNKSQTLDHRFFYLALKSYLVQNQIERTVFGSAQPQLTVKGISEFKIPLPPTKKEQRSIATALSDVDALIASLDKLIAKKRSIKTATMQQLLTGKKRLPGFGEGKGYKKTAIGEIPEDWEVVSYGEHFNIISGLGFKKSEYADYGVSLLRIDNISYGEIAWDSIAFLPQEYIDRYKDLVINCGDILLALNRPITNGKLKIAIAKELDVPAILYQRVGKIIFTSQRYDKYCAFYLLSKFIKQFVEESSVGSDQPFISTNNLKKYKIVLPLEIEEQRSIATVLSDMDAEIAALEARRAKTQAIKQGMMQELLTGRIRLKIEE